MSQDELKRSLEEAVNTSLAENRAVRVVVDDVHEALGVLSLISIDGGGEVDSAAEPDGSMDVWNTVDEWRLKLVKS